MDLEVKQASVEENEDETWLSYAEQALRAAQSQKRRRAYKSKYRPPTGHVSPTSNIVERTNSHAKLIMCDRRKHMSPPWHLEYDFNFESQQSLVA